MAKVNPINGMDQERQKRSMTESQKKNLNATEEGVVVNSCIKDGNCSMNNMYDTMVISDNVKLPEKIYENKGQKEKSILPISLVVTGVMAAIALMSVFVKKNARIISEIDVAKKIEAVPRNVSINDEINQAIFQMVQCPSQKTILAGAGVLTITAMAFMGKMFINGFKEVWVKKKEADIQKNLQEKLIAVETQSFSGKIQIIRNMLGEKAKEFSEYLSAKPQTPPVFKNFNNKLNFAAKNSTKTENKQENALKYIALGLVSLAGIVGFGFAAMKNLGKSKEFLEKYIKDSTNEIEKLISSSNNETKNTDKQILKTMFRSLDPKTEEARKLLKKLKWENGDEKKEFIKEIIFDLEKSTAKASKTLGGDGPPKATFYSHVNDYRAFLYNYLLDVKNPQFKQLFFGITGVSAISYGGSVLGEAIKEVQVKKMNAQTELELQQRLVSTELRNFKAKKDAAIEPLCEEFYAQLRKSKPKAELKTMAENILLEVKNGPPFVYS